MPPRGSRGVSPGADQGDRPALHSLRRQVGATLCQTRAACRGRPPRDRSPPSPPRYLRAAAPGPEACCSSSFSRQAGAARRRRRPGGRGRSARLAASLLPREAQGPLSRAAAPRPVSSLWLGHGGTAHRRAREVGVRGGGEGSTPSVRRGQRGGARGPGSRARAAVGDGWPRAGGCLGSAATARVFPAGRGGEGEGD